MNDGVVWRAGTCQANSSPRATCRAPHDYPVPITGDTTFIPAIAPESTPSGSRHSILSGNCSGLVGPITPAWRGRVAPLGAHRRSAGANTRRCHPSISRDHRLAASHHRPASSPKGQYAPRQQSLPLASREIGSSTYWANCGIQHRLSRARHQLRLESCNGPTISAWAGAGIWVAQTSATPHLGANTASTTIGDQLGHNSGQRSSNIGLAPVRGRAIGNTGFSAIPQTSVRVPANIGWQMETSARADRRRDRSAVELAKAKRRTKSRTKTPC